MRRLKGKFSLLLIASVLIVLMATTAIAPASAQLGVWRDINPTSYISPPANPQLNSVYMFKPGFDPECQGTTECGWAVGDSRPTTNTTTGLPAIFHYDGQTWNFVPAPQFMGFPTVPVAYNLTAVTFGPPGAPISPSDGWAVGFTNFTFSNPSASPSVINGCKFANPVLGGNDLACTGLAVHWDGVGWRLQTAGLTGTNAGPLWDAFMISPTDVWAVGENTLGTAGVFWHWTGVPGLGGGWNMPQAPVPHVIFYSIFMVSSTEGWAVGSGGAIWHYTGGAWSAFTSPASGILTCGPENGVSLRSIDMISPSEGWAVGDCGTIIQYTSGTWNGPVSPGTTSFNLLSVVMVSSTEGWAFGQRGTIVHYSGGSWSLLSSNLVPTSPVGALDFNSAYFNSPGDGWGVGTDGVIMHFDGTNYGTVTSPTINNFTSISFGPPLTGPINPNDGWAVGNASAQPSPIVPAPGANTFEPTVYHWNGFVWTKGVAIGTTNNLNSVFMLNTNDVWAVGGGTHSTASCTSATLLVCPVILHFTGGSWNTITPPPGGYVLKSIFMVSSTEGWAVGETAGTCTTPTLNVLSTCSPEPAGIILHYTVSGGVGTWAVFPSPSSPTPTPPLNSIFMLSTDNGWTVGDNATILQYTVSGGVGTWNPIAISGSPTLSTDANLTSIFMLSPTSGWVVGGVQNGCSSSEPCETFPITSTTTTLSCLFPAPMAEECQNPSALAAGPVSLHWDGTKWEPVPMPPLPGKIESTGIESGTLKSVFFTNPNDGWTVGLPGKLTASIYHWDGTSWSVVVLSPPLIGQIPGQVPPILSSVYMTSEGNGWIVGGDPGIGGSSYFTWPPTNLNAPASGANCGTGNVLTAPPGPLTSSCPAILADPAPFQGKALSAILQFSAFGGQFYSNSTQVIVSTVTTQYTAASTSTTITRTFSTNSTITIPVNATTGTGHPGIPGFPTESIIAGVSVGLLALIVLRRRRFRGSK